VANSAGNHRPVADSRPVDDRGKTVMAEPTIPVSSFLLPGEYFTADDRRARFTGSRSPGTQGSGHSGLDHPPHQPAMAGAQKRLSSFPSMVHAMAGPEG
jgi:hypothetical protein